MVTFQLLKDEQEYITLTKKQVTIIFLLILKHVVSVTENQQTLIMTNYILFLPFSNFFQLFSEDQVQKNKVIGIMQSFEDFISEFKSFLSFFKLLLEEEYFKIDSKQKTLHFIEFIRAKSENFNGKFTFPTNTYVFGSVFHSVIEQRLYEQSLMQSMDLLRSQFEYLNVFYELEEQTYFLVFLKRFYSKSLR